MAGYQYNFDSQYSRCITLLGTTGVHLSDAAFLDLIPSLPPSKFQELFSPGSVEAFSVSKILSNAEPRHFPCLKLLLSLNSEFDPTLGSLGQGEDEIPGTKARNTNIHFAGRNYLLYKTINKAANAHFSSTNRSSTSRTVLGKDLVLYLLNDVRVARTLLFDSVFGLKGLYHQPFGLETILQLLDIAQKYVHLGNAREQEKTSASIRDLNLSHKGMQNLLNSLHFMLIEISEGQNTSVADAVKSVLDHPVVNKFLFYSPAQVELTFGKELTVIPNNVNMIMEFVLGLGDLELVEYLLCNFTVCLCPGIISMALGQFVQERNEQRRTRFIKCFVQQKFIVANYHFSSKLLYIAIRSNNLPMLVALLESGYCWPKRYVRKCFQLALGLDESYSYDNLDPGIELTFPLNEGEKKEPLIDILQYLFKVVNIYSKQEVLHLFGEYLTFDKDNVLRLREDELVTITKAKSNNLKKMDTRKEENETGKENLFEFKISKGLDFLPLPKSNRDYSLKSKPKWNSSRKAERK